MFTSALSYMYSMTQLNLELLKVLKKQLIHLKIAKM